MTRKQTFRGKVGKVAGNNYYDHPIMQPDKEEPESQRQSDFAKRTGIWCPKPAREWLESLLDRHHFTARELKRAWSCGSIGWNAEKNTKRISTPWGEAAFAYVSVGIMGLYFLLFSVTLFLPGAGNDQRLAIGVYSIGAVWVAMCWMVDRSMLSPRRVAMRIRRAKQ